jgi:DNA recombination protein RmuC
MTDLQIPIWLAVVGVTAACGLGIGIWLRRQATSQDSSELAALRERQKLLALEIEKQEHDLDSARQMVTQLTADNRALETTLRERQHHFDAQLALLESNKATMRSEFENLTRQLLGEREKEFSQSSQQKLSALLGPLGEKIDGFQHRVNQVHADLVQNSASLTAQIKGLEQIGLSMSSEANNLSQALKGDKKLVGNWGEAQLERTLELAGLRRGEHYDAQTAFKDESGERFLPDFVLRLPEGKQIVIDSKVSLVDYERAIAADNDAEREAALAAHAKAVRNHIEQLSKKDYANLPGMESPDFVLMFMPVEPAYIEVMREHRDLFNFGYQKNVVLVSHTTLMPILRTVANLWMIERSNAEAKIISERAGDIYNAVCLTAERLLQLGGSLQTVTKRYNDSVRALAGKQGLYGKVDRFQQLSGKANRQFPDGLATLNDDIETHSLTLALDDARGEPDDG